MIEDAQEIFYYLPISFRNEAEGEYVNFLWDVFNLNCKEQKYQFAFLAYHMLFMCFVYFEIWQIMHNIPDDFRKALIGFRNDKEAKLIDASSPFALTEIDESVVFRFLKLVGMNNSDIGKCTKIVKDRNGVAHSNGNIFFKDEVSLSMKIDEILRCVGLIQNASLSVLGTCYRKFLAEGCDPGNREFIDNEDQIREILVYGNYLSVKDIAYIKTLGVETLFDWDILKAHPGIDELAETLGKMNFGEEEI